MTFIDLFETRFEILRVSAFYRPQKIENWSIFDKATAHNVKSVKNCFGRFLKRRKKFSQLHSLSMTLFGLFETRFEIGPDRISGYFYKFSRYVVYKISSQNFQATNFPGYKISGYKLIYHT